MQRDVSLTHCESATSCGHEKDVWIVVPARGGSVGIPRKNLAPCAGKPLIQHVIETSQNVVCATRIVVITDSPEIAEFVEFLGVSFVLEKAKSGPNETLDEKLFRNVEKLRELGAGADDFILTLQPTSPLTTKQTIMEALFQLRNGYKTSITVANDAHLRWGLDKESGEPAPKFQNRLNRQQLPPDFRETGGVVGVALKDLEQHKTRIIEPVGIVEVGENESIDIDSFGNLFEAEHWLTRGKVLIRVEANQSLGMGHLYRCLAIAYELSRHEILLLTSTESSLVPELLAETPFQVEVFEKEEDRNQIARAFGPDLIIFDILDTSESEVRSLHTLCPNSKLLTFEDEGGGASLCDIGIYDLTNPPLNSPSRVISGAKNSILGPSFELFGNIERARGDLDYLLLTFGGTDPSGLTQKVLHSLASLGFTKRTTIVIGLGAKDPEVSNLPFEVSVLRNVSNMATLISRHLVAISSMGRTVFELAAMAVPTLTFAQNPKELGHTHIGKATGSIFGGAGYEMSVDEMAIVINRFLQDSRLHQQLIHGSDDFRRLRSNKNVIRQALAELGLNQMASR